MIMWILVVGLLAYLTAQFGWVVVVLAMVAGIAYAAKTCPKAFWLLVTWPAAVLAAVALFGVYGYAHRHGFDAAKKAEEHAAWVIGHSPIDYVLIAANPELEKAPAGPDPCREANRPPGLAPGRWYANCRAEHPPPPR